MITGRKLRNPKPCTLLGGSWVVTSGVIRPLIWTITTVTRLITLLLTTHEPPSTEGDVPYCSPEPPQLSTQTLHGKKRWGRGVNNYLLCYGRIL